MTVSKRKKNMSIKITTTSTVSFDSWFTQKIEAFITGGQEAQADSWLAAMRAKTAAEEAAGIVITIVDANTTILSANVVVLEFNTIFEQWIAESNAQFVYEEVA